MLKLLAQVGVIGAIIAAINSYIDSSAARESMVMLKAASQTLRDVAIPGVIPAAVMNQAKGEQEDSKDSPPGGIAGRAFHNTLPLDCVGEKLIDLEGRVSCDQGRRRAN